MNVTDPQVGSAQALVIGGHRAVGTANNANDGEEAIRSPLRRLDGIGIPYTGAGVNRGAPRAPAIVTHEGLRFGFVRRTSLSWATGRREPRNLRGEQGHSAWQQALALSATNLER